MKRVLKGSNKMKTLLKTTLIVSALTSMTATAKISVSDTDTAVFNIGGTILSTCKVNGTSSAKASSLVIDESNVTQDIGTLDVWCNTGGNATTIYSSANNGFLVDGANKVAYTLDVGDIASDVSLTSNYTASATAAGSGDQGDSQSHDLKITPISTGLDYAGDYSDTITVTVSYN